MSVLDSPHSSSFSYFNPTWKGESLSFKIYANLHLFTNQHNKFCTVCLTNRRERWMAGENTPETVSIGHWILKFSRIAKVLSAQNWKSMSAKVDFKALLIYLWTLMDETHFVETGISKTEQHILKIANRNFELLQNWWTITNPSLFRTISNCIFRVFDPLTFVLILTCMWDRLNLMFTSDW